MSRQQYKSRSVWFQSPGIKLIHGYNILGILEKLNRNKPKFQLRNKMDKFSFLLQDQLQSLCKRSCLYKRNCALIESDWTRRPSWSFTTCKSPKLVPSGQSCLYQDWHHLGPIISEVYFIISVQTTPFKLHFLPSLTHPLL